MSVGQGSTGVHAPPAGAQGTAGITYTTVDESYFEARRLKRHARVWSLWALGVGAVISGHYSGWNLGLSNGFGSMFFATIIIAIMYLGLTFSLAEMSPALPHTGGAYSFARTSMGPWAGYITGIAENIEFVLTPAVIVFFIGSYLSAIFEHGAGLPARLLDPVLRALRRRSTSSASSCRSRSRWASRCWRLRCSRSSTSRCCSPGSSTSRAGR